MVAYCGQCEHRVCVGGSDRCPICLEGIEGPPPQPDVLYRKGITLDQYQAEAMRTAGPHDLQIYGPMGLCGEAGEVIDYIKKVRFHGHDLDRDKIKEELGDVLWYLVATIYAFDFDFSEVAVANVAKLQERYPDGFDAERSKNRGS